MAIAFDAKAEANTTGTSLTFSHTCTGSNLLLVVNAYTNAGDVVTGITYAGVAMTLARKEKLIDPNTAFLNVYTLVAPATGANNVIISCSSSGTIFGASASYTDCAQSGQPEATATASNSAGAGETFEVTVTTVNNNSWLVIANQSDTVAPNAVANGAHRTTGWDRGLSDSNGPKSPAGAYTSGYTWPSADNHTLIGIAITDVAATPATAGYPPTLLTLGVG